MNVCGYGNKNLFRERKKMLHDRTKKLDYKQDIQSKYKRRKTK